ncbi:MAG: hypothetical protein M0Z84_06455 [Gammaproteobacteria bacterium]|nr:hypothetical protein [Gammaproteobacteria bacterium]
MRKFIMVSFFAGLMAASVSAAFAAGPHSVTVIIHPEPGFYVRESGKAVLTAEGDKTRVVVTLRGEPKGAVEPIHIHEGVCGHINPKPTWGLNMLRNGRSVTVVPVSLETLLKGKYAINAHKSPKELTVYVACGNITE